MNEAFIAAIENRAGQLVFAWYVCVIPETRQLAVACPRLHTFVSESILFHEMGNKAESETAIIRSALRVIGERLPSSWTLTQTPAAGARQAGPSPDVEALLTGPDGKSVRITIEAKRVLRGFDGTKL